MEMNELSKLNNTIIALKNSLNLLKNDYKELYLKYFSKIEPYDRYFTKQEDNCYQYLHLELSENIDGDIISLGTLYKFQNNEFEMKNVNSFEVLCDYWENITPEQFKTAVNDLLHHYVMIN